MTLAVSPNRALFAECFQLQDFVYRHGTSVDEAVIKRISGTLEGVVGLVPELPDSPFLINEKTGKRIQVKYGSE